MPPISSIDQHEAPDVSVIIPFRNRDLTRLEVAIRCLSKAASDVSVEIIVSDFGSDAQDEVRNLCMAHGAQVVRTEADHWSRSACLNRGIAQASGRYIQCNDADMLWAPRSLGRHVAKLDRSPGGFINFQVWDLPPELTESLLSGAEPDWDLLRINSHAHSRWGHGLILSPAQAIRSVGGFDERMHTYGLEDLDLTKRLRSAGWRQRWAGNDGDELFHIWHPRVPDQLKKDPGIAAIVKANRELYRRDDSIVRNRELFSHSVTPLVSVVIATRNRKRQLLEAIRSCFYQTVRDIEIVIIDDGSTDGTGEAVTNLRDCRIQYAWQEQSGIASARNHGTSLAKGFYIAVLDDDDLMLPDRLEIQLNALTGKARGCVGNILNFDDVTGELETWGDTAPTMLDAVARGGFAAHPSWLVEKSLLEELPYDESLSSAVDNNLALRALRSGIEFTHCCEIVTLRRRHHLQVTATDSGNQKMGAKLTHLWYRSSVQKSTRKLSLDQVNKNVQRPGGQVENRSLHESWLPDHLVDRSIEIFVDQATWEAGHIPEVVDDNYFVVLDADGGFASSPFQLNHATWDRLVELRSDGVAHRVIDVQLRSKDNHVKEKEPSSVDTELHSSTPGWTAFHRAVEKQVKMLRESLEEKEYLVTWLSQPGASPTNEDARTESQVHVYTILGRHYRSQLNTIIVKSAAEVMNLISMSPCPVNVYIRRAPLSLRTLSQFLVKETKESEPNK